LLIEVVTALILGRKRNFLARTAFYSFTFRRMKQKAYAAAGVDIDLGNRVKATLPT